MSAMGRKRTLQPNVRLGWKADTGAEWFRANSSHRTAPHRVSRRSQPTLAHFLLNSIEDLSMDAFQWHNTYLEAYAADPTEWEERQTTLWKWAILAPFNPTPG